MFKQKCPICKEELKTRMEQEHKLCWVCYHLKESALKESHASMEVS